MKCYRCNKEKETHLHFKDLFDGDDFAGCDVVEICAKCSKKEEEYALDLRYKIVGNKFVKRVNIKKI